MLAQSKLTSIKKKRIGIRRIQATDVEVDTTTGPGNTRTWNPKSGNENGITESLKRKQKRKRNTESVKEGSKIPKKSPGAYIFQKALFEGLIFVGAYIWREICVSKSIGLAL